MLEINNISIHFKDFSLKDLSLTVDQGDYLVLLGVSGAGKTILLEILAGLLQPQSGRVLWKGIELTKRKIQDRPVGLVYQDLSLFPHLSVYENIAFAMKCRKQKKEDIELKVSQLSELTGVAHLLQRFPGTLSGGEAQRVALARTLACDPDILLLDEPLSNLDITLRSGLIKLLQQINQSGKTIIHVTHNFEEAAALSNKIAVIQDGRLIQAGSTKDVFRHPVNAFVATFSKMKNFYPCSISPKDDNIMLAKVNNKCELFFSDFTNQQKGYITINPNEIILSESRLETSAINQLEGVIINTWLTTNNVELVVDTGIEIVVSITRHSFEKMKLQPGKKIFLIFKASAVRFIEA